MTALWLSAAGTPAAATPAAGSEIEENWYRIELAGAPAGYMRESVSRHQDEITSESETKIEIRRGETALAVEMAQRFIETTDGIPRRAWTRQSFGQAPIETTYEFAEDEVVVTHHQGDRVRRQNLPWPGGDWSTPARAERTLIEHLASGAESFTLRSVDPLAGLEPVSTHWEIEERNVPFFVPGGDEILVNRWRQTQDLVPGVVTTVLIDSDGRLLESRTTMMGLDMVVRISDRAAVETTRFEAPEILLRTFVRPPRPILRPRQLERAVYMVSVAEGELPPLPNTGAQRVEPESASRARVVVTARGDREVAADPTLDPEPFLRSSTYLAHEDPQIRELLGRALGPPEEAATAERDDAERAETLRAFVYGYLEEKDLDSGLATAVEVARNRAGDCTEHSVLLAALLRAAQIPSRLVAGLIYVERFAGASHVFGYHMWTQALIDGRWLELDATLEGAFDATHIALATASFTDGSPPARALAKLAALMGQLEIEIIETNRATAD